MLGTKPCGSVQCDSLLCSAPRGWGKGSKASSCEVLLAENVSEICQWPWSVRSGDCEAKGRLKAMAGGCAVRLLQGAASRQGAVASALAACAARGELATDTTVFIANNLGDVGTRLVNYSNYLNLPSGAQIFNLSMALNQVSDIDQRILL